jgi:hypothetical protein
VILHRVASVGDAVLSIAPVAAGRANRLCVAIRLTAGELGSLPPHRLFDGSFLRLVFAKSLSCFSDIDFSICFEAPLRLDFGRLPRFAANAAPAAICCDFDLAGILQFRWSMELRLG